MLRSSKLDIWDLSKLMSLNAFEIQFICARTYWMCYAHLFNDVTSVVKKLPLYKVYMHMHNESQLKIITEKVLRMY